jgi:hypothetical protein
MTRAMTAISLFFFKEHHKQHYHPSNPQKKEHQTHALQDIPILASNPTPANHTHSIFQAHWACPLDLTHI